MKRILTTLFVFCLVMPLVAQTFQWRGPKGDGHFNETNLLREWPVEGPELIMTVSGIGGGYSSAIVANETIYVTGRIDTMDCMTAITLDGTIKWQTPFGRSWPKTLPDARGSVTVDDHRAYAISGSGVLSCLNTTDGSIIWTVNVDQQFETEWHLYGVSETPLVVDDKVIVMPGGKKASVVAFDKMTGKLAWQSESFGSARGYASAVLYEYNNLRFILGSTAKHLIALDPETGRTIWSYLHHTVERDRDEPGNGECMTNNPIYKGLEIFISKGYDYPAIMLQMDSTGTTVREKWLNETLDNHHGGILLIGDHIYGSNFYHNTKGKWVCLSWKHGEVTYLHDWINKGNIIYADSMMYIYEDRKGYIGLVKPDPEKFDLVSSFQMAQSRGYHWAHLFIHDGVLYVRRGDMIMAYDIRRKDT